jgi:DNA-directed RNA polymerase specialized sigma24 family protein
MACAGRILVWWDRDFDDGGRPIRPDVRAAARELWEPACRQTIAVLDDDGPAAELMESAVAQVSRYLDRTGAPLASRKHGLVMVAFHRALGRYRARSSRLELLGASTDFSDLAVANDWLAQIDARISVEQLIRRLSKRSTEVLMLRAAGYDWKEIAQVFGTTVAAIRNRFWREVWKTRRSGSGAARPSTTNQSCRCA